MNEQHDHKQKTGFQNNKNYINLHKQSEFFWNPKYKQNEQKTNNNNNNNKKPDNKDNKDK